MGLLMDHVIHYCSQVLDHMPVVASDDVSIVTCDKDIDTCKAASEGGVAIYSNEYLLSGVLRQKLEPELYPYTSNFITCYFSLNVAILGIGLA